MFYNHSVETYKVILYVGINRANATFFNTTTYIKDKAILQHGTNYYYMWFDKTMYTKDGVIKYIKQFINHTFNSNIYLEIRN